MAAQTRRRMQFHFFLILVAAFGGGGGVTVPEVIVFVALPSSTVRTLNTKQEGEKEGNGICQRNKRDDRHVYINAETKRKHSVHSQNEVYLPAKLREQKVSSELYSTGLTQTIISVLLS